MKVEFKKAQQMLEEILKASGASAEDAKTILDLSIEESLLGTLFSVFVKGNANSELKALKSSIGTKEEIIVDMPSLKLIKGNGRSAELITAQTAIPLITKMAKAQGIAIVGIFDSTYNGSLETFARIIAAEDLIGIMSSNGGPQGVVPFGGKKDIFGTNPLSYAVPTNSAPIAFDAATAQFAYGNIKIAKEDDKDLPANTYLTKEGEFTTDPNVAHSLIPFGGYKGYAINLLLEILTGMMVQAKSGLDQEGHESEIGTIIIAIDPSAFGDVNMFKSSASKLVSDIEAVPAIDTSKPVRVPGRRGEKMKQEILSTGLIEVAESSWAKFEASYAKVLD